MSDERDRALLLEFAEYMDRATGLRGGPSHYTPIADAFLAARQPQAAHRCVVAAYNDRVDLADGSAVYLERDEYGGSLEVGPQADRQASGLPEWPGGE